MRILYISNRINSEDGSAVHGRQFVKALKVLGHEVFVFPEISTLGNLNTQSQNNQNIIRKSILLIGKIFRRVKQILKNSSRHLRDLINLYDGYFESRGIFIRICEALTNNPPELVVYRSVPFDFTPNFIRRKFNPPMIGEVNAIVNIEMNACHKSSTFITKWAENHSFSSADAMSVVSDPIKRFLESSGTEIPIAVVGNGVDLDDFKPNAELKAHLKKHYDLTGKVTIGYIGSYKKWHGLDISMRVMEKLIEEELPVHFVLIGSGDTEKEIKELICSLSLNAHVTQIPNLAHDQVAEYINLIDIALMTYPPMEFFYFSPLKMYEYLANGVPVISSRLGQIETVLSNAPIGVLVSPGDVNEYAAAIRPLVLSNHRRTQMSRASRTWAEQNCAWTSNASEVIALSEKIAP